MRIADEQVAVAVDAQAAGPAVAVVGRRPRSFEVIAVRVEDLNARGPIDDVDAVIGVDGGGARLDQLAGQHAAPPPYELRLGRGAAASRDEREAGQPRQASRGSHVKPHETPVT